MKNTNPWEKRLAWVISITLLGYIATVAGDVRTNIEVLNTKVIAIVEKVNENDKKITKQFQNLHSQDLRLTKVETCVETHEKRLDRKDQ